MREGNRAEGKEKLCVNGVREPNVISTRNLFPTYEVAKNFGK